MTRDFLANRGYTVLEADSPARAIEIAQQYQGPIHLLLSDMVMPGMSGRELAENLVRLRAETRVLYMSGYPGQSVVRGGFLDSGASVLQKPFTDATLPGSGSAGT